MRIRFSLSFTVDRVLRSTITTALGVGVVKMNVDIGAQWAHWEEIKNLCEAKEGYFQGWIENPEGVDKPLRGRARGVLQDFGPWWLMSMRREEERVSSLATLARVV